MGGSTEMGGSYGDGIIIQGQDSYVEMGGYIYGDDRIIKR
jgi:hypothetical protein